MELELPRERGREGGGVGGSLSGRISGGGGFGGFGGVGGFGAAEEKNANQDAEEDIVDKSRTFERTTERKTNSPNSTTVNRSSASGAGGDDDLAACTQRFLAVKRAAVAEESRAREEVSERLNVLCSPCSNLPELQAMIQKCDGFDH